MMQRKAEEIKAGDWIRHGVEFRRVGSVEFLVWPEDEPEPKRLVKRKASTLHVGDVMKVPGTQGQEHRVKIIERHPQVDFRVEAANGVKVNTTRGWSEFVEREVRDGE